jgi:PEP-CTERM motif
VGSVEEREAVAGTGNLTPTGSIVPLGTWHNYQIKLDYQTDTYTVIFDGLPLHTETFVGGTQLERFTEANILATFGSTNAADLARTGVAFFDNFVAREGMCNVIPEPTTVGLVALGLALAPYVARRRQQAGVCRG